jgi:hypothetical protein
MVLNRELLPKKLSIKTTRTIIMREKNRGEYRIPAHIFRVLSGLHTERDFDTFDG